MKQTIKKLTSLFMAVCMILTAVIVAMPITASAATSVSSWDQITSATGDYVLTSNITVPAGATFASTFTGTLDGNGYTITGNSVQVPYTKRVNIFGDVKGMMRANRFRADGLHIVGNAGCEAVVRNLQIFGGQNAQNLDREFAGNILHYTNNVANAQQSGGTTYSGAFFAVAPGMVGFLSRVSRPELNNTRTRIGHEWGTEVLPGLGLELNWDYIMDQQ